MKPLMVLFGSATLVFSLAESFTGNSGAMVVASLLAGLLLLMEGVNRV